MANSVIVCKYEWVKTVFNLVPTSEYCYNIDSAIVPIFAFDRVDCIIDWFLETECHERLFTVAVGVF